MAQFKRFNTSENDNYNSSDAFPEGTLTWDPSNGLRLHDGSTGGGNTVGGNSFSGNYNDLTNKPTGTTALHDLIGGASSADNGKFLQQTSLGVSEWVAVPFVSLPTLKQIVADSVDFADFKSRISAM